MVDSKSVKGKQVRVVSPRLQSSGKPFFGQQGVVLTDYILSTIKVHICIVKLPSVNENNFYRFDMDELEVLD